MNAHDAVEKNLTIVRDVKETACADGPEDLVPILLVEWEDGEHALVALPDRDLVIPIVKMIRGKHDGAIVSLTFSADALIREWRENDPDAPKSVDEFQRGELTEQREAGDMSVQDVLIVTSVDVKGDLASTMQRYGYDDGGHVVWGESTDLTDAGAVDGAVPDVLRKAIAQ